MEKNVHNLQGLDSETNNIFDESLKFLQLLLAAQKQLLDKLLVEQRRINCQVVYCARKSSQNS